MGAPRGDCVVLLKADGVPRELDGFELGTADTLTGFVGLLQVRGGHLQPCFASWCGG